MDKNLPKKIAGLLQYRLKGPILFVTWCVLLAFAFLVLLALMFPALNSHPASRRSQCQCNLGEIAHALQMYKQAHGSFPPAYKADAHGKPMHSWRVLILPYLGRRDLYDAYRFDEPWDGPNNRKLADLSVSMFRCGLDNATDNSTQNTSYVAVVGPNAAFTGEKGMPLSGFKKGAANTILIVETLNSGINWLEPRDLYVGQMARTVNPKAGQGISSKHKGGANAAFADGCVRYLDENLSPEELDALITRDGGEDVDISKP